MSDNENTLVLSSLTHTWILDLDGTIVRHNGYKLDGHDTLLPNALEFLRSIPIGDMIILVTSRKEECRGQTETFLAENKIRYDHIIFDAPYGERIVLNDDKLGGLKTSIAISKKRDSIEFPHIQISEDL